MAAATSVADAIGDPTRKDVVIAILGASAALGGFVLVFLGLLISAYQAYPADTPQSVKSRQRQAAWPTLGAFSLSIGTIGAAALWLGVPRRGRLFRGGG